MINSSIAKNIKNNNLLTFERLTVIVPPFIAVVLTLLVTVFSFILSFEASKGLAEKLGVSYPYLIPLIVEGTVIVFTIQALAYSLLGKRVIWQWIVIVGATILATVVNVVHAVDLPFVNTPIQWQKLIMAAFPTVFLLLNFEATIHIIKTMVNRSIAVKSGDDLQAVNIELTAKKKQVTQELENLYSEINTNTAVNIELTSKKQELTQELENLQSEIKAKKAEISILSTISKLKFPLTKDNRKKAISDLLSINPDYTHTELGQLLKVTRQTISKDLGELK